MKKCTRCKVEKELSEFNKIKKSKDGLHNYCRACCNNISREWHENNKKKANERRKEWNKNNKERVMEQIRTPKGKYKNLKSSAKFKGIELQINFEQYTEILKENKCFYCDASLVGSAGHSLNRIDNNKGYLVSNVKPCCGICNKIMNNFTKEEIKTRVYKIIKRME